MTRIAAPMIGGMLSTTVLTVLALLVLPMLYRWRSRHLALDFD